LLPFVRSMFHATRVWLGALAVLGFLTASALTGLPFVEPAQSQSSC
jgi:hypothetical protein